jgi:hypothetical protein
VQYAWYFKDGLFVEEDEKVYVEWLKKAANQNNPLAMDLLGDVFKAAREMEKALLHYRGAVELGWTTSMHSLAEMLTNGEGCAVDSRRAVMWSARCTNRPIFWHFFENVFSLFVEGTTDELEGDFGQLCYSLGWGMYWYVYGTKGWVQKNRMMQTFGNRFVNMYCSCVELQQKSIFTFLWFWNRTTGIKGPGVMIAQMVWEERENNLVKAFVEGPETKRIKK